MAKQNNPAGRVQKPPQRLSDIKTPANKRQSKEKPAGSLGVSRKQSRGPLPLDALQAPLNPTWPNQADRIAAKLTNTRNRP